MSLDTSKLSVVTRVQQYNVFIYLFFAKGEECQDQDEKCPALARKGECLKDAENMLVRCRKSCFMCGGMSPLWIAVKSHRDGLR